MFSQISLAVARLGYCRAKVEEAARNLHCWKSESLLYASRALQQCGRTLSLLLLLARFHRCQLCWSSCCHAHSIVDFSRNFSLLPSSALPHEFFGSVHSAWRRRLAGQSCWAAAASSSFHRPATLQPYQWPHLEDCLQHQNRRFP